MIKSRGLRNNNPFNIRKSKSRWIGKIKGSDKEFETFDNIEHGYRAGLILFRTYYVIYKLHSYGAIIRRFAPSSENNLDNYLKYLKSATGIDPEETISLPLFLTSVAPFIAFYESSFPFGVSILLSKKYVSKFLKINL